MFFNNCVEFRTIRWCWGRVFFIKFKFSTFTNYFEFSWNRIIQLCLLIFFLIIVFVQGGSPTPHPFSSRPHFVCKFSRQRILHLLFVGRTIPIFCCELLTCYFYKRFLYQGSKTYSFFMVCASSPLSTMGVFCVVFTVAIFTEMGSKRHFKKFIWNCKYKLFSTISNYSFITGNCHYVQKDSNFFSKLCWLVPNWKLRLGSHARQDSLLLLALTTCRL